MQGLMDMGLQDAFRLFEQPEKQYSWWDYRQMAFRRNRGLRIDHILLTEALAKRTPEAPYVGWDLAVTPNGPVVIEGNHNSSVFQPKPSASGVRTGLLQRYRDAIGPGVLDKRR